MLAATAACKVDKSVTMSLAFLAQHAINLIDIDFLE
jgi:hypothetical protein